MDPQMLATAFVALVAALGTIASNFNSRSRKTRRETRRLREVVEAYALYVHTCRVVFSDQGITPPRMPAKLRRLTQQQDEDEDSDDE